MQGQSGKGRNTERPPTRRSERPEVQPNNKAKVTEAAGEPSLSCPRLARAQWKKGELVGVPKVKMTLLEGTLPEGCVATVATLAEMQSIRALAAPHNLEGITIIVYQENKDKAEARRKYNYEYR